MENTEYFLSFCDWLRIDVDKGKFKKKYYSVVDKIWHFHQNSPSGEDGNGGTDVCSKESHWIPYFYSRFLFLFYCWKIIFSINGIRPFSEYF